MIERTLIQVLWEFLETSPSEVQRRLFDEAMSISMGLSAVRPNPHPDIEAAENRRARDRERKRAFHGIPRNSTEESYNNNNINISNQEGGCGGKPIPRKSTERSHGTRLPDPWDPPENLWEQAKKELGISDADLRFETKAFRDHFWSTPGQKGRKVRWDLTWMNWMRNNKRWHKKSKDNVLNFVPSGPKRTWAEIKAEKAKQGEGEQA